MVFTQDEAGPYQTLPYPGRSWQVPANPARYPHEYIKQGTAKMLTLFEPASGKVVVKGVESCTNAVLHPWLLSQLSQWLGPLPPNKSGLSVAQRRAKMESWQEGLTVKPSLGPAERECPELRAILIMDKVAGHHTPNLIVGLWELGIMPLFTPLGGSWLNMAESIQRILKRRGLEGHHPQTPAQIIQWLEEAAAGWNLAPTPFQWGGKRWSRRQKLSQKSWQCRKRLGGSGAYALSPLKSPANLIQTQRLSA